MIKVTLRDTVKEFSDGINAYEVAKSFGGGVPDFSFSTAAGMFNSVINLILITMVNKLSKKVTETSLW